MLIICNKRERKEVLRRVSVNEQRKEACEKHELLQRNGSIKRSEGGCQGLVRMTRGNSITQGHKRRKQHEEPGKSAMTEDARQISSLD